MKIVLAQFSVGKLVNKVKKYKKAAGKPLQLPFHVHEFNFVRIWCGIVNMKMLKMQQLVCVAATEIIFSS